MLGPFATASRRTPPVLILHCHSPGVATVARRLRIDVRLAPPRNLPFVIFHTQSYTYNVAQSVYTCKRVHH